jgi:transcriptional accessory protein Tex/SPT6
MIEKIDDVLYADGWDDCLVGHGNIFLGSDGQKVVAIYDRDKMVKKMAQEIIEQEQSRDQDQEDGFDPYLEADEYISFNVEGAYLQPGMPVFATFDQRVDFSPVTVCGCNSCA